MQINNNNHSQIYKVKAKSELLAFKKLLTHYKNKLPINLHHIKIIQKIKLVDKTKK
jgi:hypothetical protein